MQIKAVCTIAVLIVSTCFSLPVFADPISFNVQLSGANEVPAMKSQAAGNAALSWDSASRKVTWKITATGLSGPVTMAHFHEGPPTKNGPVTVWLSAQGRPGVFPITGEQVLTPKQASEFESGGWYVNIHTQAHPPGEIRGQVRLPAK